MRHTLGVMRNLRIGKKKDYEIKEAYRRFILEHGLALPVIEKSREEDCACAVVNKKSSEPIGQGAQQSEQGNEVKGEWQTSSEEEDSEDTMDEDEETSIEGEVNQGASDMEEV